MAPSAAAAAAAMYYPPHKPASMHGGSISAGLPRYVPTCVRAWLNVETDVVVRIATVRSNCAHDCALVGLV